MLVPSHVLRRGNPNSVYNWAVRVYLDSNNIIEFWVDSDRSAREYAKRIITEGLWFKETDADTNYEEVFCPVHRIYKVKIFEWDGRDE